MQSRFLPVIDSLLGHGGPLFVVDIDLRKLNNIFPYPVGSGFAQGIIVSRIRVTGIVRVLMLELDHRTCILYSVTRSSPENPIPKAA